MARRAWSLLLTALACTLALVSCAEAPEAADGAWIGLRGKNIDLEREELR